MDKHAAKLAKPKSGEKADDHCKRLFPLFFFWKNGLAHKFARGNYRRYTSLCFMGYMFHLAQNVSVLFYSQPSTGRLCERLLEEIEYLIFTWVAWEAGLFIGESVPWCGVIEIQRGAALVANDAPTKYFRQVWREPPTLQATPRL